MVPRERAEEIVALAERFVAAVDALLAGWAEATGPGSPAATPGGTRAALAS